MITFIANTGNNAGGMHLSDKLVNHGLIGRVEKIEENEVQIHFVLDGKNESVCQQVKYLPQTNLPRMRLND
jgi:hypothetical protein